jgi:hypothetical protein
MVALLSLHDTAIRYPTPEEKEKTKDYVEEQTCPEWRDGWMMGDGTKFPLFQRPGLHGDAWFDKNKDYSLDGQVHLLGFSFSFDRLFLISSPDLGIAE